MSKSNVKYELAETRRPDFSRQHVPVLKNRVNRNISFWSEILLTSFPIVLYFALALGHPVYDKWLLRTWNFPFGALICNICVKLAISALMRCILEFRNGQKRVRLSYQDMILSVIPPGIAGGLDIGLSNWTLNMLVLPVYLMVESTTIIFIFGLAILFQLERKSWSLTGIVMMISGGLALFVYKSTEWNIFGILIALLASFLHAFRLTMSQHAMQKSKLGLESAIDMMYYVQPWMLISTIPVALWFEGDRIYYSMLNADWSDSSTILMTIMTILGGSLIAFFYELTQFMIISRTSSLTLCIAGIFKMLCVIILVFEWEGNLMTNTNFIGLLTCFAGIILYIIVRPWTTTNEENEELEGNSYSYLERDLMINDKTKILTISGVFDKKKWTNE